MRERENGKNLTAVAASDVRAAAAECAAASRESLLTRRT